MGIKVHTFGTWTDQYLYGACTFTSQGLFSGNIFIMQSSHLVELYKNSKLYYLPVEHIFRPIVPTLFLFFLSPENPLQKEEKGTAVQLIKLEALHQETLQE